MIHDRRELENSTKPSMKDVETGETRVERCPGKGITRLQGKLRG